MAQPPLKPRPFHAAAVAVMVLALVGCRASEPGDDPTPAAAEDRIISNVWQTDDPNGIEVGWFATACEKYDSLKVDEFPDRVDLLLRAFVDSDNCAEPGITSITVQLDDRLGTRDVFDANPFITDNEPILVEPQR